MAPSLHEQLRSPAASSIPRSKAHMTSSAMFRSSGRPPLSLSLRPTTWSIHPKISTAALLSPSSSLCAVVCSRSPVAWLVLVSHKTICPFRGELDTNITKFFRVSFAIPHRFRFHVRYPVLLRIASALIRIDMNITQRYASRHWHHPGTAEPRHESRTTSTKSNA